jgi:hypothetical protein
VWKISPPPGFDPQTFQPIATQKGGEIINVNGRNIKTVVFTDLTAIFSCNVLTVINILLQEKQTSSGSSFSQRSAKSEKCHVASSTPQALLLTIK